MVRREARRTGRRSGALHRCCCPRAESDHAGDARGSAPRSGASAGAGVVHHLRSAATVVATAAWSFTGTAFVAASPVTRTYLLIFSSRCNGERRGRVERPPCRAIAAPPRSTPRATASSTVRYAPPSEKGSGVTFRIPMRRGRPDRSRTPPGIGTRNAFAGCGTMTGRPPGALH